MNTISSRENRFVREYAKLSENRGFRYKTGRFVIEGARLAEDALLSGVRFERVFFETKALQVHGGLYKRFLDIGAAVYEVTQQVAQKMSGTSSTQGIFCTAFMLDKEILLDKIDIGGKYVALENIQDPGNLGTVLRTAEAFGIDGVILSGECTDIYSPKAVRAGMGAVFRLPFMVAEDLCGTLRSLQKAGMQTVAAVADRDAEDILKQDFSKGTVTAIGNEGNGLSLNCVEACSRRVTIRMKGRAESLNAAAAASVFMWEMAKCITPL